MESKKGNYAESSAIITCQMEEIAPFETGKATPNDLCLFAPFYPPPYPSFSLHSTSSRHTFPPLHSYVSSSLSAILPLQIYSGIQNEILSHFWLVLKRLHSKWGLWKRLPLRRCQGTESVNMQTVHSIYPLSPPHVMWPDLSDAGGKQNEGG